MKSKTMSRIMIGTLLLTIVGWVAFVFLATHYIKSGKFRRDADKAVIEIRQVVKDIEEAE